MEDWVEYSLIYLVLWIVIILQALFSWNRHGREEGKLIKNIRDVAIIFHVIIIGVIIYEKYFKTSIYGY